MQYTFDKAHEITSAAIYWFKDGEGIDVPSSYEIQYLDEDGNWVEVENSVGLETEIDTFNLTTFTPVSTTAVRVVMESNDSYSTGILEWQLYGIR